ncbi:MFS transporter [Aestuariimicrobium soli]|uniref:MFS transporter n=1 Tax=Aestuariimicrobium soli TaxID=2035834 RepID=UPI003EBCD79C
MQRFLVSASALLWGLLFSFLGPTIALLLTELFGATAQQVGWILGGYNAFGLVVSLLIPGFADRIGDYLRPMLVCGLASVAWAGVMLAAGSLWLGVASMLLLAAPATVGMTLLFAHMRHAGFTASDVLNVRAWVSFAWIAGQPLATFAIGAAGPHAVLWLILGAGVLVSAVTVALQATRPSMTTDDAAAASTITPELQISRLSLVAIFAAFVLLSAGNAATVAVTQLLVHDHRGLPVFWAGIALGTAAGLEAPALMLLGRLNRRFSPFALVATGAVSFMVYYAGMSVITNPWLLVPWQAFKSWGFATMTGVGLTLFQSIIARPGLASGLFNNASKVGAILSGAIIALGATATWSYPGVFYLAIPTTLVGLLLVLIAGRTATPAARATVAPEPVA